MNQQNHVQQIEEVLHRYELALNTSDAESIIPLYTEDGVFMPQHSPAQIGIEAVETAYSIVFQMLKLNVRFTIHEIKIIGEDYAFVRTSSQGKQVMMAENLQSDEYNNELFVFRRENDKWKIARYIFATANPPR